MRDEWPKQIFGTAVKPARLLELRNLGLKQIIGKYNPIIMLAVLDPEIVLKPWSLKRVLRLFYTRSCISFSLKRNFEEGDLL